MLNMLYYNNYIQLNCINTWLMPLNQTLNANFLALAIPKFLSVLLVLVSVNHFIIAYTIFLCIVYTDLNQLC